MKILLTKSSLWTVRPFGATIVEKSSISSSWIHSCSMLNIISWFVPLQDKGYHHDQWYVDLGLTLKSCKYLYESGSLKFSFFHSKGISILVFFMNTDITKQMTVVFEFFLTFVHSCCLLTPLHRLWYCARVSEHLNDLGQLSHEKFFC